jgi:PAS domain S-box-containing protein
MRNYKLVPDSSRSLNIKYHDPLFRAIFDESPDAIFLLHADSFQIIDCNSKALQLFQIEDKTEIAGRDVFSLYDAEPVEFSKKTFINTISKGKEYAHELAFRSSKGNIFWGKSSFRKISTPKGSLIVFRVRRVVDYLKTAEMLASMVKQTSKSTGLDFFRVLTELLSDSFGVNMVFVAAVDHEYSSATTIHCSVKKHAVANFTFDLISGSSYNVLKGYTTYYPRNLQGMFPNDRLVTGFGMESYLGTPVYDASERVTGMLVLMDNKPMEEIPNSRHILSLFASRAGAEMARIEVEQSYQRKIRELQGMIGTRQEEISNR